MRNLNPQNMFVLMAQSHVPLFQFSASHKSFAEWKSETKPRVLATLGDRPESVPLNPELTQEWTDRGILKRRFLIDVGPHISAAIQVNRPKDLDSNKQYPAICCWHGHGPDGKAPVMGNLGSRELDADIAYGKWDYGHRMAELGYVTWAIDWMGCGERSDKHKPHFREIGGGRDWCNIYYLHATLMGMTPLSINLAHGRAATDFVISLPEVDSSRLGVMGLSGGGAMTLWTALADDRFRAAEIICYSDLFALFGIHDINYCGTQIAPGLFKLVDLPDLQGLLAPMPLLVGIGANDPCFHGANAMECFRRVEAIYQAAGARENLHLDHFPGGHSWNGAQSEMFFGHYLRESNVSGESH